MGEITPTPRLCVACNAAVAFEAAYCSACGSKQTATNVETDRGAVKEFFSGSATEAKGAARELLRNKDVQKIAGGAALGAAIAPVIPFISIPVGATLGAGYVLFKRLTR